MIAELLHVGLALSFLLVKGITTTYGQEIMRAMGILARPVLQRRIPRACFSLERIQCEIAPWLSKGHIVALDR